MPTFEQQMEKIIKDREEKALNIFRAIALQLFDRVIRRTPVDTGRARANWNAAIDNPDMSTTDATPDEGSGATAPAASRASNEANRKAQSKALVADLGDTLYLTNNLPYISALEYGYSNQAPRGMVRVTVSELKQVLRREVKRND